jgi:hypothetical protein
MTPTMGSRVIAIALPQLSHTQPAWGVMSMILAIVDQHSFEPCNKRSGCYDGTLAQSLACITSIIYCYPSLNAMCYRTKKLYTAKADELEKSQNLKKSSL